MLNQRECFLIKESIDETIIETSLLNKKDESQ
jgi:hypothetical protein